MRRSLLVGFAGCLVAAAIVASPRDARAGVYLGAEFNAASPIDTSGVKVGYGFTGTGGYRISLGPIFVQPEAQGSYITFPTTGISAHATRILGGARLGLGRKIQPTIFGHAGIGWLGQDYNGPAFDGGFALGFKLIPFLRFGGQVAYNVVTVPSFRALKWLSYGVHAGVEF